MDYLLFFLIVIGAAFILPELAKKIRIPYVTSIIIAGILIGPFGFNILDLGEAAMFLGSIGAVFLMFTAGLDVRLSHLKLIRWRVIIISVLNAGIPFAAGYYVGYYFGYNMITSLILGAMFMSSSIAIIVPSLKEAKLSDKKLGKTIIGATVFEDIGSLLLLAFLLQYATPKSAIPFPFYVVIILLSLGFLFVFLPKIQKMFVEQKEETQKQDIFEKELRFIFFVLIVTALFFEFLGMHAIIAGFLVGLILSDVIKHRLVFEKIYTISYGVFIPIFFLVVGMKTDILLLLSAQKYTIITAFIVLGLIISKFLSGWLGGVITKHSLKESTIMGVSTIPQLSTTLVVALIAFQFGILDNVLINSIIILSIITTIISPILIKILCREGEVKG